MSSVLCRVDAGPVRGLGHLQRCLSLAEALKRQALDTTFLAPPLRDVEERIDRAGCERVPFTLADSDAGTDRDWIAAVSAAHHHQCDIVIVDSYAIGNDYLVALRDAGLFVVVLDDLARHSFAAQIVVNGGAGAQGLRYVSSAGDTQFLLGPHYALLGSAFCHAPENAISTDVARVLVSVGGGSNEKVLARVLSAIDMVSAPFVVTAVVGPFVEDAWFRVAAERYRHEVTFVRSPPDLRDLMLNTDLAVSAGGQTLYELAATGTPSVAVEVFDNQELNVLYLVAEGVVRYGGRPEESDFARCLSRAVTEVIGDNEGRTRMSAAGRRMVDGCGATRVAGAIARATGAHGADAAV